MTTTTARTDVHRPADVDPANYVYLGAYYQGDSEYVLRAYAQENARTAAAVAAHGVFRGNHDAKNTCDHCGVHYAHGVAFLHTPTDEVVNVGHQCAGKTFGLPDRAAVVRRNAERAAQTLAARAELKAARDEWQAEHAEVAAHLEAHAEGNAFYQSLLHALNRYGKLTERQTAAVERNIASDLERAAAEAARPAPVPVVTGDAVVITGTIRTIKWQQSQWGGALKCRVVDDRGFAVWGTLPAAVDEAEVGDRITFIATVEVSDNDPSFGYHKGPKKARRVA